nr:MAG TPA: hypothetical protein [Caudoviricetes sp.]
MTVYHNLCDNTSAESFTAKVFFHRKGTKEYGKRKTT